MSDGYDNFLYFIIITAVLLVVVVIWYKTIKHHTPNRNLISHGTENWSDSHNEVFEEMELVAQSNRRLLRPNHQRTRRISIINTTRTNVNPNFLPDSKTCSQSNEV